MAKQVIVAKCLENGQKMVFKDLEEASRVIGVSGPAISTACGEARACNGWMVRRADKVFAVQTRLRRDWIIAVANNKESGYIEYGNPVRKLGAKEVDRVKDITVAWYYD